MENGLKLTWWQVITLCIIFGGGLISTMVNADNDQTDVNKNQDYKITCKLDKTEFKNYQDTHSKDYDALVDEVKGVRQQVIDSEKEIIRILTRMENR